MNLLVADLFGVPFAYHNGGNELTLDASAGNWILGAGIQVRIATDGFDFNFIPTASSLDYQLNDPADLAHYLLQTA